MQFKSNFWLKISLVNLLLVALLGLLMRYKIGFEFPFLDQKHLHHSHSHFAFSGWVSHTLMVLMISFLEKKVKPIRAGFAKSYNTVLLIHLLCAYGMFASFLFQGYGPISILFSTASILVSFVFAYIFYKDLRQVSKDDLSKNWFKAALFFAVLSSLGTFALAYMMMTKTIHQVDYLLSIYFYLHFQYNGWFFFASMGLFISYLELKKEEHSFYAKMFWLFFIACLPAYFLSTLWLDLPVALYALTAVAAALQAFAWFRFLPLLLQNKKTLLKTSAFLLRFILLFVGFALSLKFLLQLGSIHPQVSQLAFGFRPIVIAYLHLVLLAIISLYLLFHIFVNGFIAYDAKSRAGLAIFTIGVLLNEAILAVQGIASFSYTRIPYVNGLLFGAALLLVTGMGMTALYSLRKGENHP